MLQQAVPVIRETLLIGRLAIDEEMFRTFRRFVGNPTVLVENTGGHENIDRTDALDHELQVRTVIEDHLVAGHQQAQGVRNEGEAVVLGNQAGRPDTGLPKAVEPRMHARMGNHRYRQVPAGTTDARRKVQVLDFVRDLFFERERQRRPEAGPFRGQIAGQRRSLAGRDQHDDLSVTHVLHGFLERPHDRRCPARSRAIDRNPAGVRIRVVADPYDKKFRHRHVVPRLRRIGTTCPVGPRCNVLK